MDDTIQQKIIDYLKPVSGGLYSADVRIGLGYTSVRLNNGNLGLAWTARSVSESCTHQKRAGTLAGSTAQELLEMLIADGNPLARSIGLATANALAAGLPHPESTSEDTLDIVNIQSSDRVVMVGFFGPLIPELKKTGCKLDILELKTDKPGTMSPEEGKESLASSSVAVITATSVITGTIDELLAGLGKPRAVIILGPSSIMCPPVFSGTPVTHIGGAWVLDAQAVERIVSEGGGTMILKKYLDFETVCL
ncbi:MAG: DUF364 domain-containing protein [Dehalococcoidales bacterium]|nr:DUF364 domain-containing protein [Dehalococcoidales bacterium]